jgi:hypothetical protein
MLASIAQGSDYKALPCQAKRLQQMNEQACLRASGGAKKGYSTFSLN